MDTIKKNLMKAFIKIFTEDSELEKKIINITYKDVFVVVQFKSSTIFSATDIVQFDMCANDNNFNMSISAYDKYLEFNFFVR